jgi:hypothetical protein
VVLAGTCGLNMDAKRYLNLMKRTQRYVDMYVFV